MPTFDWLVPVGDWAGTLCPYLWLATIADGNHPLKNIQLILTHSGSWLAIATDRDCPLEISDSFQLILADLISHAKLLIKPLVLTVMLAICQVTWPLKYSYWWTPGCQSRDVEYLIVKLNISFLPSLSCQYVSICCVIKTEPHVCTAYSIMPFCMFPGFMLSGPFPNFEDCHPAPRIVIDLYEDVPSRYVIVHGRVLVSQKWIVSS